MSVLDLYNAAYSGNNDEVVRLLARKVDINGWVQGLPGWVVRPIYGAVCVNFDNSRVINTLAVSGADINYGAYKGDVKWWVSPLWKAAHSKVKPNVLALIRRGALMINQGIGKSPDLREVNYFVENVRLEESNRIEAMQNEMRRKKEEEEHQKRIEQLEVEKKRQQQKLQQDQQKNSAELLRWLSSIKLPHLYDELIRLGISDISLLGHLKESHLSSNVKIIEREILMKAIEDLKKNSNSKDEIDVNEIPFNINLSDPFEIKYIDPSSNEFKQLKLEFSDGLQGVHNDYVADRIKKGLKPIGFSLRSAKKIINSDLFKQFEDFRKSLDEENKNTIKIGYHGTAQPNLEKIALNGLLKIGHPKNPSKSTDPGYFGSPQHGVYIGKYIEYTLKYTQRPLRSVLPGDRVEIVRFKILPGKSIHIPNISLGMLPTKGYNCHLSPNYLEWFLFDERQCYPEYILEIEAFENQRVFSDDGTSH